MKGKKMLIKVKVSSSKYQMSVLHKKGENVLEADTISEAVCFSSKKKKFTQTHKRENLDEEKIQYEILAS